MLNIAIIKIGEVIFDKTKTTKLGEQKLKAILWDYKSIFNKFIGDLINLVMHNRKK